MNLTKKKHKHYLLIKLNARDWRYLKGFRKYEPPKHVKSMEKYLSKVVSLHIKAIFVMTSALILEAEKKITSDFVNLYFVRYYRPKWDWVNINHT